MSDQKELQNGPRPSTTRSKIESIDPESVTQIIFKDGGGKRVEIVVHQGDDTTALTIDLEEYPGVFEAAALAGLIANASECRSIINEFDESAMLPEFLDIHSSREHLRERMRHLVRAFDYSEDAAKFLAEVASINANPDYRKEAMPFAFVAVWSGDEDWKKILERGFYHGIAEQYPHVSQGGFDVSAALERQKKTIPVGTGDIMFLKTVHPDRDGDQDVPSRNEYTTARIMDRSAVLPQHRGYYHDEIDRKSDCNVSVDESGGRPIFTVARPQSALNGGEGPIQHTCSEEEYYEKIGMVIATNVHLDQVLHKHIDQRTGADGKPQRFVYKDLALLEPQVITTQDGGYSQSIVYSYKSPAAQLKALDARAEVLFAAGLMRPGDWDVYHDVRALGRDLGGDIETQVEVVHHALKILSAFGSNADDLDMTVIQNMFQAVPDNPTVLIKENIGDFNAMTGVGADLPPGAKATGHNLSSLKPGQGGS